MNPDFNYPPEKSTITSHIIEFVQTLVIFLAIGSIIYLFVAQPHKVSGASMKPNFMDGDYIITDKVSLNFNEIKKGDIIVFKDPQNENQEFIKRVIATPNDKIKIENNRVYLNSVLLREEYLPEGTKTEPNNFIKESQEITVPASKYFVMGDNREGSSDSRVWGFVDKSEIIGRVFLRYWPKDSIGFYPASLDKFK
jgi:signal peptidase I